MIGEKKKQRNEEWYDDECRGAIKRTSQDKQWQINTNKEEYDKKHTECVERKKQKLWEKGKKYDNILWRNVGNSVIMSRI